MKESQTESESLWQKTLCVKFSFSSLRSIRHFIRTNEGEGQAHSPIIEIQKPFGRKTPPVGLGETRTPDGRKFLFSFHGKDDIGGRFAVLSAEASLKPRAVGEFAAHSRFATALELQPVPGSQFQFLGPTDMKMLQMAERNGTDAPAHFDRRGIGSSVKKLSQLQRSALVQILQRDA
jgi:hypothetical protein